IKRRRSSMTELAFHGIHTSRRTKAESVTHVSGTFCHLCLGPLTVSAPIAAVQMAASKPGRDAATWPQFIPSFNQYMRRGKSPKGA
ncbi:hypothetical protein, partial [Bradyrhizobium canariense]|uniref:hypothetical protein n=1 Tax=Bradyrhizobium canariense TaxID=255045 RepID=UPI001AECEDC0